MMPRLWIAFAFLFWCASCGHAPPSLASNKEAAASWKPSTYLESQSAKNDSSINFSLYLPSSFSESGPNKMIVFLDAQGDGKLPVSRYKTLADRYGFILMGSLNSKNGLPFQAHQRIFKVLQSEALDRFHVPASQLAIAGFSGGARVAAMLAQGDSAINAVMGCGAGFNPTKTDGFSYYGLVGQGDFNFQEFWSLGALLREGNKPHHLATFPGAHHWPPVVAMDSAFLFVGKRMEPLDSSDVYLNSVLQQDSPSTDMNNITRVQHLRFALGCLQGKVNTSELEQRLHECMRSPSWLTHERSIQFELTSESNQREKYGRLLQTATLEIWELEAARLQKQAVQLPKPEAWTAKRILGYLSLSCYMYANQAMAAGDWSTADHYVGVYAKVDATNSEHAYLKAVIEARMGRSALPFLSLANDLGFRDVQRVQNEPAFFSLQGNPSFQALLNNMKSNPPPPPK